MHTENTVVITGPKERIFALAAAIGDWPAILPHYRWVRVFHDDGRVKQAEMAARRGRFPVKWRTVQVLVPEADRILFFHTGGVTRGMYVEWRFAGHAAAADPGAVRVTITHDLRYPLGPLTGWFAHRVVGDLFVRHIAGLTLARIKQIVEREEPGAGAGDVAVAP
jgi:ribosome-associated toxin RatA of RatAB toxin-antitoxin module